MVATSRGSRFFSTAAIVTVASALACNWRASTAPVSAISRLIKEGFFDKSASVSVLAHGGRQGQFGHEIIGVGSIIRACEFDAAPVLEIGDALDIERRTPRLDAEQGGVGIGEQRRAQ